MQMDLLDILFDLLGLAIALIGKFWVVILAGLSYLLFGKKKEQKRRKPTLRPVLTPTADGGYPTVLREEEPEVRVETTNPFSRSVEYVESDAFGEHSLTPGNVADINDLVVKSEQEEQDQRQQVYHVSSERATVNPREAMKWSLIFAPPRSKQPYQQQLLKSKQLK